MALIFWNILQYELNANNALYLPSFTFPTSICGFRFMITSKLFLSSQKLILTCLALSLQYMELVIVNGGWPANIISGKWPVFYHGHVHGFVFTFSMIMLAKQLSTLS